jgi:hypothetical protein
MRLFGFGKSATPIQGSIGFFGLEDWWLTEFSDDERHYIQATFQPVGSSGDSLTSGSIASTTNTVVKLLSGLASWFRKPDDRAIAHKILNKAVAVSKGSHVLDLHFLYHQMIETYYKDRDNPEYMKKAVEASRLQIALAPDAAKSFKAEEANRGDPNPSLPGHTGYKQLAIILEKEGRFQEAIALSRQAEIQGWTGDWTRRVERCKKKLKKA